MKIIIATTFVYNYITCACILHKTLGFMLYLIHNCSQDYCYNRWPLLHTYIVTGVRTNSDWTKLN